MNQRHEISLKVVNNSVHLDVRPEGMFVVDFVGKPKNNENLIYVIDRPKRPEDMLSIKSVRADGDEIHLTLRNMRTGATGLSTEEMQCYPFRASLLSALLSDSDFRKIYKNIVINPSVFSADIERNEVIETAFISADSAFYESELLKQVSFFDYSAANEQNEPSLSSIVFSANPASGFMPYMTRGDTGKYIEMKRVPVMPL